MASVREEYDNILSLRRMWLVIQLKKKDVRQVVLHHVKQLLEMFGQFFCPLQPLFSSAFPPPFTFRLEFLYTNNIPKL